jgi:hypothetical protein
MNTQSISVAAGDSIQVEQVSGGPGAGPPAAGGLQTTGVAQDFSRAATGLRTSTKRRGRFFQAPA